MATKQAKPTIDKQDRPPRDKQARPDRDKRESPPAEDGPKPAGPSDAELAALGVKRVMWNGRPMYEDIDTSFNSFKLRDVLEWKAARREKMAPRIINTGLVSPTGQPIGRVDDHATD